jgi:hypothetical protein
MGRWRRRGVNRLDTGHEPRTRTGAAGGHEGLKGVRPADTNPEESRGKLLIDVTELRSFRPDRSGGGLEGRRTIAVPAALVGTLTADIALPARELGDLGGESRLHQEANVQASHLFQTSPSSRSDANS